MAVGYWKGGGIGGVIGLQRDDSLLRIFCYRLGFSTFCGSPSLVLLPKAQIELDTHSYFAYIEAIPPLIFVQKIPYFRSI